eukprot:COSAG02_NODE_26586_length_630_cov_0.574388_1_plen_180_part_01
MVDRHWDGRLLAILKAWKRTIAIKKGVSRLQRSTVVHKQRRVVFAWHSAAVSANYTNTLLSHMEAANSVEAAFGREIGRVARFADQLYINFLKVRATRRMGCLFRRWHQNLVAGMQQYSRAVVWSSIRGSTAQELVRVWVRWRSLALSATRTELVKRCDAERCGFKLVLHCQQNRLEKLQ